MSPSLGSIGLLLTAITLAVSPTVPDPNPVASLDGDGTSFVRWDGGDGGDWGEPRAQTPVDWANAVEGSKPKGAWAICRADEPASATGLCWRDDLPPDGPTTDAAVIDFPALVWSEFQRITIAPSPLTIQPDAPRALVDVPVIAYTNTDPQRFQITLLGVPLEIEARPSRFSWDFGDGTVITTTEPGAPYPHQTVEHAYTQLGTHHVTLTTSWTGRFRIATDWIAIPGAATTTGTSHDFEVYGVEVRLVPNPGQT